MKEPTDAIGNKLFQGALVAIRAGNQVFVGNISFLSNGGITLATGGNPKPQQTNGQLVIDVQIPLTFEPGSRIGAIYCLIDPNAQSLLEKAAKQAAENAGKPFAVPGAKE